MVASTETASIAELLKQQAEEREKSLDKRDNALLEQFDRRIKAAVDAQAAALNAEWEKRTAPFSLPGSQDEKHKGQKFSFARAMAGLASGDFSVCPMERAMHDALKSKAMSFGTDTAGGFLVPNEVLVSELIPLLYAASVAVELGATSLTGLNKAPVQIPRVSGGTTAHWVGEAASITASDMALEQLTLTPHGLAAITIISDLLQVLDSAGVEAMIRADMARQLGLKLDLGAMAGTGGSGQPIGIINASGVNTTTISDPATYDQLLAAISEVRADNALMGRLGWACSNADMLEFEQIKDLSSGGTNTSHQQLQRRLLLSPDGKQLLGYPVRVSTQLSDGQIIFGNWADLVIAQWGGMRLDVTNALGFQTAQSHIRALTYVDVGVRHAQSFCIPA